MKISMPFNYHFSLRHGMDKKRKVLDSNVTTCYFQILHLKFLERYDVKNAEVTLRNFGQSVSCVMKMKMIVEVLSSN